MTVMSVVAMSFLLSFLQKPLVDFGWMEAKYTWVDLFVCLRRCFMVTRRERQQG